MTTQHPRRTALGAALTALLGCSILSACGSGGSAVDSSSGPPRYGGTLTVGIVGGSAKDNLDAHIPLTHPDESRVIQLYSTLMSYDTRHHLRPDLADRVTSSDGARTWTVHLRPGLRFSDGRPITSQDVVASFKRIDDPKDPKSGASTLSGLELDQFETPDPQTVVFHFRAPFATFEDSIAQYENGVVPADYDPAHPVSSGPFEVQSFTPGQESVFVRNPDYWQKGRPYLDKLVLVDFPDDTARVNALLGGQVDAIDQLPLADYNVIKYDDRFHVLESQTGSWLPFTMRVDRPPFNDPRVREAFRLIVDRKQMVEQVLGGHGAVGNDMYGRFDACYPSDLPQRSQDIEKAKQLLAEAGQSHLSVDLVTSPAAAGLVEAAQVFAQQAKAAGVTVNVKQVDPGTFYGDQYLKWTFSQDFWFTRDYLPQAAQGSTPDAPYNETHWSDPTWQRLVEQADAQTNQTARCALIRRAEQIEYDKGGYIIWGFPNDLDAYSSRVHGLEPDESGIPLTSFGFSDVWLSR